MRGEGMEEGVMGEEGSEKGTKMRAKKGERKMEGRKVAQWAWEGGGDGLGDRKEEGKGKGKAEEEETWEG
ncbi:hypothetical protein ACH5RR_011108 [Cinchona calisaya]|uniref:Uncharacterized protein n=1 Tax=Cinchona calisaya TaxID=153742 RepID=A0ABD3A3Y7_9GENT